MRQLQKGNTIWHIFDFNKPFLDSNFDDESGHAFDAFGEKLNEWSHDDDIRYFISTGSLANNLTFQIEKNLSEQNQCWLCIITQSNDVVGAVLISKRDHEQIKNVEGETRIFVDDIVVNPKYQNQGIGSNILTDLIEGMPKITEIHNIDYVYASIKEDNSRSKKVFEKNGFSGTDIVHYSNRIFYKPISKPPKQL